MDKMKNGGHTATAEAENSETMDLLTGMLDAATHCGENTGGKTGTAQAAGEKASGTTPGGKAHE